MGAEAVVFDILHFWDRPTYHGFMHHLHPRVTAMAQSAIVAASSRSRAVLVTAMRVAAGRLARAATVPAQGEVLIYAPTANNIRALMPLAAMLAELGGKTVYPPPAAFRGLSRTDLQVACDIMAAHGSADGFVQLQLLRGLTAYFSFKTALYDHPARAVMLANDHHPVAVGLRHAARSLDKAVIYRQHAPIADHYPPLNCDLALLHNDASRQRYAKIGGDAEIKILPWFTGRSHQIHHSERLRRWVLILSRVPNHGGVARAIRQITQHPEMTELCLRHHPDGGSYLLDYPNDPRITQSCGNTPLEAALAGADIIVAPGTGAVLETLHLGVPTLYVPGMDMLSHDPHGLVAAGVLPEWSQQSLALLRPEEIRGCFDADWAGRFSAYDPTTTADPEILWSEARAALRNTLKLPLVEDKVHFEASAEPPTILRGFSAWTLSGRAGALAQQ